ncbi:MAG: hypothetical protein RLZZ214_352, partial [Verrucomicrobiota bacterium]
MIRKTSIALSTIVFAKSRMLLRAEESGDTESYNDLALQLVNPVASLLTMPLLNNVDWGGGPDGDGFPYRIN